MISICVLKGDIGIVKGGGEEEKKYRQLGPSGCEAGPPGPPGPEVRSEDYKRNILWLTLNNIKQKNHNRTDLYRESVVTIADFLLLMHSITFTWIILEYCKLIVSQFIHWIGSHLEMYSF